MLRAAASAPDSVVVLNNLAQTLSDLGSATKRCRSPNARLLPAGHMRPPCRETRDGILKKLGKN